MPQKRYENVKLAPNAEKSSMVVYLPETRSVTVQSIRW